MEIRPTVAFPERHGETYYPGRQAMGRGLYIVGGGLAALGAIGAYTALTTLPPGTTPAKGALLYGFFFAVGMAAIVSVAMVRRRTAIALTAAGLYYRDWLNRVWHIPWDNFEQVSIRERFLRSPRSLVGMQQEMAYLVGRFVPEGTTAVRVGISSHVQWMETPDIHPDPMMSSIVRRAGLVPGEPRPHELTWVRAGEGGQPSPQIDTDAF